VEGFPQAHPSKVPGRGALGAFRTDSFWEGVDVPGESLEIVVIVRLPFAVPTEPIIQAQMEEIEKSGKNPFMEFSVRKPQSSFVREREGSSAAATTAGGDHTGQPVITTVRLDFQTLPSGENHAGKACPCSFRI